MPQRYLATRLDASLQAHLSGALHLQPACLSTPPPALSCRRPTLAWKRSWQKWSWRRCRGRSRPAPRTTHSPAWCGRCTSPTRSSQTVSPEIPRGAACNGMDLYSTFLAAQSAFMFQLSIAHTTFTLVVENHGCPAADQWKCAFYREKNPTALPPPTQIGIKWHFLVY